MRFRHLRMLCGCLLGGAVLAGIAAPRGPSALPILGRPGPLEPRYGPTDLVVEGHQDPALFSKLDAADQEWRPRSVPIPGGGTRYVYKRLSGEPPLNLEQVKALMRRPPRFDNEQRDIRRLLLLLRRIGVAVVLGPPRQVGAAGEWEPRRAVLRIRGDVPGRGSREFLRVLNHEAIHVAQSCRSGNIDARPMPLGLSRSLDRRQRRHLETPLYANASPRDRILEEEAYANQHSVGLTINLLNAHCRSAQT